MELPFILVGAVLLGGGLGQWIDLRLDTTPLFTFLLGLLGFAAGVREIIRRIPKDGGQDDA
ncbi:MAG TPA: AtpZ/AtpI family protein [Candidatus Acidoferrales bacterium]|nr:AtpZ/AtpI family protein [Candidatus Acidoferrales bacterium]